MRKLIGALLVLILAAAAVWWNWPQAGVDPQPWLTGNIEMTTVDVGFPTGGRLIELLPQEGDSVAQGELLGRLDPDQMNSVRDQATAKLRTIQSRILETDASIEYQLASHQSQLTQANAQQARAQASLSELQNGSRQEEIAQAEALLREAHAALDLAEQERKRFLGLYETGDISQQQQERTESGALQARARVEQMEERLQLLQEGPREERIRAARATVDASEGALAQVRAQVLEITRTRRLRDSLQAEQGGALAEIERISASIDDLTAYSPIEGHVLTRNGEPGEIVPPGRTVLRVANTRSPWIRAYIPESEIGKVALGASARVRTDSFPGKFYSGTVSYISEEAEFTPKQIQTREQRVRWVYRIKIRVENPDGELKLNMPCEVQILTQGAS